jgi:predicted glycoside hydrolase/deacetylase ChbG (UPF0249 family)
MSKKIIICADDFGMSDNINKGIISLLEKKIINATSCMTNMPAFVQGIKNLNKTYNESIYVGIHLNLTEGMPFTQAKSLRKDNRFLSLSKLLIKSEFRLINYDDVYSELKEQVNKFVNEWGDLPDFIDGHQHIHHFPIIRNAVVNLYKEFNMYEKQTYIRSTCSINKSDFKSKIIYYSGAKKFNDLLIKNNIKHNTSFAGIYSLGSDKENFREIMLNAYQEIKDGGLIMCHPSIDVDVKDSISQSRVEEFNYFESQQALLDQIDNKIKLVPNPRP